MLAVDVKKLFAVLRTDRKDDKPIRAKLWSASKTRPSAIPRATI